MILLMPIAVALLSFFAEPVEQTPPAARAGDTYELIRTQDVVEHGSEGQEGTSHDQDMLVERVLAVRPDGLELEYDLPSAATADDRRRVWEFPARIFKSFDGASRLLNRADLERRLDAWLLAARWPRSVCGRHVFTWNVFRIECDPESVIRAVRSFDPGSALLRDGAPYEEEGASGSAPLRRIATGPEGETFVVILPADPEVVRRERVEADLVVAEISRRELAPEAAQNARSRDEITGTVRITFETDAEGRIRRSTRVTRLQVKEPSGETESREITRIVERRRVRAARAGQR